MDERADAPRTEGHAPRGLVALLLLALWLGALVGCGEGKPPGGHRVLLIGIDGASPRLMGPLMEAGRLPHLAALAKRGHYGKLRSVKPLYSPRIWNSIVTGKTPDEHGILSFVYKDKGGKHLYLSTQRRVPALWNITSHAGMKTAVVNWWTTFPPDEIDGAVVSDHFFPEQIAMLKRTFKDDTKTNDELVYPPDLISKLRPLLDIDTPLTSYRDFFKDPKQVLWPWVKRDVLSHQFQTDSDVTRVALALQKEMDPQVMLVFLPGIDRVSHWLWGALESPDLYPVGLRGTEAQRKATAEVLRRYYEYTDALIGRLTETYGRDDLIMIVSDHGFEHRVELMLLTGGHESDDALDGIVFAAGRDIEQAPGGRSDVYQVTPTILAWLGLPLAADMHERPAPFYAGKKPTLVASYDSTPVERMTADAGMSNEIVHNLKALGYLEDDVLVPDASDASEAPAHDHERGDEPGDPTTRP